MMPEGTLPTALGCAEQGWPLTWGSKVSCPFVIEPWQREIPFLRKWGQQAPA